MKKQDKINKPELGRSFLSIYLEYTDENSDPDKPIFLIGKKGKPHSLTLGEISFYALKEMNISKTDIRIVVDETPEEVMEVFTKIEAK